MQRLEVSGAVRLIRVRRQRVKLGVKMRLFSPTRNFILKPSLMTLLLNQAAYFTGTTKPPG